MLPILGYGGAIFGAKVSDDGQLQFLTCIVNRINRHEDVIAK